MPQLQRQRLHWHHRDTLHRLPAPDAAKAVRIARREYGYTRPGFKFLLYDAPRSTFLDDFGYSRADQDEMNATGGPAVLIATYRTKPEDLQ